MSSRGPGDEGGDYEDKQPKRRGRGLAPAAACFGMALLQHYGVLHPSEPPVSFQSHTTMVEGLQDRMTYFQEPKDDDEQIWSIFEKAQYSAWPYVNSKSELGFCYPTPGDLRMVWRRESSEATSAISHDATSTCPLEQQNYVGETEEHIVRKCAGDEAHCKLVAKLQAQLARAHKNLVEKEAEIKKLRSILETPKKNNNQDDQVRHSNKSWQMGLEDNKKLVIFPTNKRNTYRQLVSFECGENELNYIKASMGTGSGFNKDAAYLLLKPSSSESSVVSGQRSDAKTTDSGTSSLEGRNDNPRKPTNLGGNRRRDCLHVFQGAPLVWIDSSGKRHPMLAPNYEKEMRYLREAVEKAKAVGLGEVDVVFEEATTTGLVSLLATGCCNALHLSVHGDPEYLCMENNGALQPVLVSELQGLFAASNERPKLVFVAACNSRPAGEAFIESGVQHVVCCKTDESLQDSGSVVFAQAFYTSLSCGHTLKASFELARHAVLLSPQVVDPRSEMSKFLLLPEKPEGDLYHDVPIFYTSPLRRKRNRVRPRHIPSPPGLFLGRQVSIFETLQALETNRCALVQGPPGIGKSSVAKAVLNYAFDRPQQFNFEKCIWVPAAQNSVDCISKELRRLFEMCKNWKNGDLEELKESAKKVAILMYEMCALVAIDARGLSRGAGLSKLAVCVDELLSETRCLKIIVVCPATQDLPISMYHDTTRVLLGSLDVRSSIFLFGNSCKFVRAGYVSGISSSQDLVDLLAPEMPFEHTQDLDTADSDQDVDVIHLIRQGNPGCIRRIAKNISMNRYFELIRQGIFHLDKRISLASHHGLQETARELGQIRERLPSMDDLELQHISLFLRNGRDMFST